MLDASNLGQIIGRLQYGELERRRQPAATEACNAAPRPALVHTAQAAVVAAAEAPPKEAPAPKVLRQGLTQNIRAELAACSPGSGLTVPQLMARLKCNANHLSGRLSQMKDIQKSGERGLYVYRLKAG